MKNNIELAAEIQQRRPAADPEIIARAVVKLRKLAKTLSKRADDLGAIDNNASRDEKFSYCTSTDAFYTKAYKIAGEIDCNFESHNNAPGTGWQFYLRIDDRLERLV